MLDKITYQCITKSIPNSEVAFHTSKPSILNHFRKDVWRQDQGKLLERATKKGFIVGAIFKIRIHKNRVGYSTIVDVGYDSHNKACLYVITYDLIFDRLEHQPPTKYYLGTFPFGKHRVVKTLSKKELNTDLLLFGNDSKDEYCVCPKKEKEKEKLIKYLEHIIREVKDNG